MFNGTCGPGGSVFFYKEERAQPVVFTYCIVPKGRAEADALVRGNLYAPNLNAAKRYVPTMKPSNIRGHIALEVILIDDKGKEVWRGPYTGNGA